jgi:hypothetical protein
MFMGSILMHPTAASCAVARLLIFSPIREPPPCAFVEEVTPAIIDVPYS